MKVTWCVETNLLVWVDVEELSSGYANLASGVGQIPERICKYQIRLVCGGPTQLVQALVHDGRCDSCRSPDTLGICGEITLVTSCGAVKLHWEDALEGVRHLTLPASTWRSFLDLVDILTIAIA